MCSLIYTVLNDDQWSLEFVLDSNELTSMGNYKQSVLKQLIKLKREWIEQQQIKPSQDNMFLEANYRENLLVAQQNIQSLQERLLELESQHDRQRGNLTNLM